MRKTSPKPLPGTFNLHIGHAWHHKFMPTRFPSRMPALLDLPMHWSFVRASIMDCLADILHQILLSNHTMLCTYFKQLGSILATTETTIEGDSGTGAHSCIVHLVLLQSFLEPFYVTIHGDPGGLPAGHGGSNEDNHRDDKPNIYYIFINVHC